MVVYRVSLWSGEKIEINLMRSRTPQWELKINAGTISLWPSLLDDRQKNVAALLDREKSRNMGAEKIMDNNLTPIIIPESTAFGSNQESATALS
jgi:hypothetical protein